MEYNQIKDYGTYLKINEDGYIINPCSADLIQDNFRKAAELSVEHIKKKFRNNLYSVYIRGSVARGTAIENVSDIDLFIVTKEKVLNSYRDWKRKSGAEVMEIYPFINGVEFHMESLDEILSDKRSQFLLQSQSIKFFGKEINFPQLSFKLGKESYAHLAYIENDIRIFYEDIHHEDTENSIDTCSWIAKRIVRTGFEIVMKRENLYTRDLYPCYKSFIKYYSYKKNDMEEILELAVFPVSDKERIIKAVRNIEELIISESQRIKTEENL